jgi:hypothetical protein
MQIENENNKMRRDLMLMEETKQNLEKLLYEQNLEVSLVGFGEVGICYKSRFSFQLRKYDRNRDQSQTADLALRTALAVLQEKNTTLEKNLSAGLTILHPIQTMIL